MLGIILRVGRAAGPASVALLVLALAMPAVVAGALGLQVVPNVGQPGDTMRATATGFASPPGEVTFWWDGTALLGVDPTITDGQASLSFEIPAAETIGTHLLRACHGSACIPGRYVDATVTVTGPTATPTSRPTPRSTPRPTPSPTPKPSGTPTTTPLPPPTVAPSPSVAPTRTLEPTSSPGPSVPAIPIPLFPVVAPTPTPAPLPFLATTPAPQPPSDEAAPETTFPNLSVTGIEITQGIQNLGNDMPLVSGRKTYARVYIDVALAESWPNTWGALEARRNGQQVGWIWPENGPITARSGGGERTDLDDSLQFRLPAAWLSGEVTLTAFVFSYAIETPFTDEPDADDNVASETVTFHDGQPLTLHLAPLHLHRSFHPSDVERIYFSDLGGDYLAPGATVGGTNRILAGLVRYLPLASVSVDALTSPVTPLGHAGGHEWDLGGICKTSLVEWNASNNITLADWTVLMEDPSEVDPAGGGSVTPDRAEVRVMDRTFTVDHFYAQGDGTGSLWGSSSGFGPEPIAGAPAYAHDCLIIVPALREPNETLALYRVFYDWADEREYFAGMIDATLRTAFGGGIASGGTDSISMRMTDSFSSGWPWWHSGAETIGHEIAHRAGLGHVPCRDDDDGGLGDGIPDEIDGGALDLTHPMTLTFPDCWLSEVDPGGYYGFDANWQAFGLTGPAVMSNDPAAPAPNRAYPLLGYEFPGWPDPYHYCRLLTYYGVPCSPTALDLPWNPPNPKPDGSDPFAATTPPPAGLEPDVDAAMVLVSAGQGDEGWSLKILARSSSPTLHLREQIAAAVAVVPTGDEDRLVVLDPGGAITWQAVIPSGEQPHGAGGPAPVALVVPIPPDAAAIEVRGPDSRTKARIEPSVTPPHIIGATVEIPAGSVPEIDDEVIVVFEHGDADGRPNEFTLLYAPDGEHWQVIHRGTSEGSVPVPVADLPSGDAPAFRIVVFDGWAIAEALLPVPELGGPRNGPTIVILASGPASYPTGSQVLLEATAFDLEDRALAGGAISWASSLDGNLGAGSELATRDLSRGLHTITASATDSDGLTGAATYVLQVDPSVVEVRPSAEMEATMSGVFGRLAAGIDPAPAAAGENQPDFLWLPIMIGALLVAALIVVANRVIRTRRSVGGRGQDVATLMNAELDGEPAGAAPAAGTHGQKDQDVTIESDGAAVATDGDVRLKGSKIKEN